MKRGTYRAKEARRYTERDGTSRRGLEEERVDETCGERETERKGKSRRVYVHVVDGYRVPNRDPRDRVIRIEMNVNPLNTIPGQNTATRGSESGQIRYRAACGAASPRSCRM